MNKTTYAVVGAAAVVVGAILFLQGFDAEKVACNEIDSARTNLQAMYDAGVTASVQVYAEEKAQIDERLSECLSAKPVDPCADAQKARDAAVEGFNSIPSPADDAPYAEFKEYFKKRDDAYNTYKTAKDALDQCRAANPPKADVPYEQSDTKACFDAYDASVEGARNTFNDNTQTMKAALKAAMAALDAREKACNPPTGDGKFTEPPRTAGDSENGGGVSDLASCKLLNPDLDSELFALRQRAAAIPAEIQSIQTSIDNAKKRMSPFEVSLRDVDTYIPPESTKTQFEGALNALRAERKVNLESIVDFYKKLIERKQAEKAELEQELKDVNAKIKARLDEINRENAARQQKFPTALHLAKPESGGCEYYHCHGLICGLPDPAPNACGQGATTQEDVDCKQFFNSYLQAAGVN